MRKLIGFMLLAGLAFAEGTQTWTQSTYDDFTKGTAKGVAIRSTGALEIAPAFKQLYTSPSTYIWASAADSDGNLYLAAGSPARVYKMTPDGKATVLLAPTELQVQAIAVDSGGTIYAATSPDGKVYKITRGAQAGVAGTEQNKDVALDPGYTSQVFFDPKTKYIWNLALDSDGRLYVATGDRGQIFRVDKSGQGSVFFKSDEAHIRALTFDKDHNLIAGSDGSGLIYRISPGGEGFVLYSAPKKEITALAVDKDGNIYAAGDGEKRNSPPSVFNPQAPVPNAGIPMGGATAPIPLPGVTNAGGSEVYMLAPDGAPRRLWSSKDDIIYALAFDSKDRLLAGTGNKGRIIAIERNGDFEDLEKASANQVIGFAPAPNNALYVSTSNLGKVFTLAATPDTDATYESDVFDAHNFSKWGRAEVRGSGDYDLFARSGNVDNPDRNWSQWAKVDLTKNAELGIPPARFAQWKVVMRPANGGTEVDSVRLNYLAKNVAPVVDEVVVQPGARFNQQPAQPRPANESITVNLSNPQPTFNVVQPQHIEPPMPAVKDRDSIAVRWAAHDDNDDQLTYSLYYKGDGETKWKLLKADLTDRFYSFDSSLLPDGGYTLRVVASDAPSHSPEDALTDSRESDRFEVDNTPPVIESLNAKAEGNQLHISFSAVDAFSPIKRAEYSIDAGDFKFVAPVGGLSDAKTETYDFNVLSGDTVQPPAPKKKSKSKSQADVPEPPVETPVSNEHVVVVRVFDRFDNQATAKFVVK